MLSAPPIPVRRLCTMVTVTAALFIAACSPATSDGAKSDSGALASTVASGGAASARTVGETQAPAASAASLQGIPAAPLPSLTPSRDDDQEFLRHMVDHHAMVVAHVHGQMMDPSGHAAHGTSMDPSEWDSRLDAEKAALLGLLKKFYGEDYTARASAAPVMTGGATAEPMKGMVMPAGESDSATDARHDASRAMLVAMLRGGAKLVDRHMPTLRRPAVRDLARRIRASELEMEKRLAP